MDYYDKEGDYSLHDRLCVDATYGNLSNVYIAIDDGVDIHHNNDEALLSAVSSGQHKVAQLLIDNGADISVQHDNLNLLAHTASSSCIPNEEDRQLTMKCLLKNGFNVHQDNDCAARAAAGTGNLEALRFLHLNGADIYAVENCALGWSAEAGYTEVVKYLLENKADMNQHDDFPLIEASKGGHIDVVNLMVLEHNMTIKPETIEILKRENCEAALKIINSRDLSAKLEKKLTQPSLSQNRSKSMKI